MVFNLGFSILGQNKKPWKVPPLCLTFFSKREKNGELCMIIEDLYFSTKDTTHYMFNLEKLFDTLFIFVFSLV